MLFVSSEYNTAAVIGNQVSISESRCFSFQDPAGRSAHYRHKGFNLGIEMLFVSSEAAYIAGVGFDSFQSRNRDAFRFKENRDNLFVI